MSETEIEIAPTPAAEAAGAADQAAAPALDQTLGRALRVNWELLAWLALVLLTLVTRLWFLGDRAMSHDESLHTYYSWRLYNGEGYVHDPMMHGPLLYHLTALVYFLAGVSDYTARLISVFFGLGLVLAPLLLRRYLGPVGAWVTGAILLFSPTVLYYSRYIRHDIHVEFFIVLLFAALFRFLDTRKGAWPVVAGVAAAGAITSAEMSYIMGFVLVAFFLLALTAERLSRRLGDWLAVAMGTVGLGLLIFAVFAGTGQLGDAAKGSSLHLLMQFGLLASGILMALSLGIGLLARFGTAPVTLTARSGRTLRDILAPQLFGDPDSGARPAVLAAVGAAVLLFGAALTHFLLGWLAGSTACGVGSTDARCVLAALLGMGLPALGFLLLLLAVAGAFVRAGAGRANLYTTLVSLLLLFTGLALFWYQHHQVAGPEGTAGGFLAPEAMRLPALVYVVDGLILAAGLGLLYGFFGWLLERDEERGLAEALAGAPTWSLTLAVLAFLVIYVLMFTTFFSNPKGIYGFWDSAKYWTEQHDVVRGDQPWYYYGIIAPMYEFLPLLLALAAILVYALRPALRVARGNEAGSAENPEPGARLFLPMLISWSIGVFWIFSWAGEKMPWLIVHLVVPQALLAGRLVADMASAVRWPAFRERGWQLAGLLALLVLTAGATLLPFLMGGSGPGDLAGALQNSLPVLGLAVTALLAYGCYVLWRALGARQGWLIAGLTLTVVLALLNLRYALMANYVNDELATEYIVYAHGTPDDRLVYDTLRDLQERVGVDQPLKIIYDDDVSWPFTWYFRDSDWADATYVGKKPSGGVNADVALVGSANYSNFEPYLGKRFVSTEFTRMWWPNEGYKGLTLERLLNAVTDPKERRNWLNILLYRRYTKDPQAEVPEPKALTDWYHHSNMRLYVRKELLDKAWPLVQSRPEFLRELEVGQAAAEVPELKLAQDLVLPSAAEGKNLSAPKDLALAPDGSVYVVDHGNYRVVAYGPDGTVKGLIGDGQFVNMPTEPGKPEEPTAWGIGVGPDGSIYVADTWKHQVVKLGPDGRRLRAWGTYGNPEDKTTETGSFYGPRDVAVGPDGNVYVTDTGNSRILVFTPDGEPVRAIVDAGPELGALNEPTSLAFDPATGELYVADLWNRRIVRWKADLTPDIAWDVDGWSSEEAAHKAYLAVGPGGVVVASDPAGQRVWLFARDGRPLGTLDLPMDEQGLDQPIGVAVDPEGRVLVAASNTGRVTRYVPADVIVNAAAGQPAAGGQAGAGEAGAGDAGGGEAGAGPSPTGEGLGQPTALASPSAPAPGPTAAAPETGGEGGGAGAGPTVTRLGPFPNPPPAQP